MACFALTSGIGLRVLKIGINLHGIESNLPKDQFFLSKVTGILAFKKMARKGIKVAFVEGYGDVPCECSYFDPTGFSCCSYKCNHTLFVFSYQVYIIFVSS